MQRCPLRDRLKPVQATLGKHDQACAVLVAKTRTPCSGSVQKLDSPVYKIRCLEDSVHSCASVIGTIVCRIVGVNVERVTLVVRKSAQRVSTVSPVGEAGALDLGGTKISGHKGRPFDARCPRGSVDRPTECRNCETSGTRAGSRYPSSGPHPDIATTCCAGATERSVIPFSASVYVAAALFEFVCDEAPENPEAFNNLGFCLVPKSPRAALRHLDTARRLGYEPIAMLT